MDRPEKPEQGLDLHERLSWLALVWGAELGPAGFARTVAAYGSATAALQADPDELVHTVRLKPEQARAIAFIQGDVQPFAEELADVQRHGVHVFWSPDEGFPGIVRELPHPPPVVCVDGEILPVDDLAVAIVGTRSPTGEGADMAGNLARALANEDFTVVSGLARGIDTAAHQGAVANDGRTIAVLGSGILNVQPPENTALAVRIRQQGALLSELPPQAPATIPNLMARNRLTSLLARAVIVVECRATGGSLATAGHAVQQGRELLAVPWTTPREQNAGNRKLLQEGATPLEGPAAIRPLCQKLRRFRDHKPPPPREQAQGQMRLFGSEGS